MSDKAYRARAVKCPHTISDEEVYEHLKNVTASLDRSWAKIESAKKIVIKMNTMMPEDKLRYTGGRRQELVDNSVAEATFRLLRERSDARIVLTDTQRSWAEDEFTIRPIVEKYGAEYAESNNPPHTIFEVPGGGQMFQRYQLGSVFEDADAMVSVATLKSHAFMGITLTCKNLFGLPPRPPHGRRPRTYFHHTIRLAHVLGDLGRIVQPCLNIIDGMAAQSLMEWGGDGRIADVMIAGDHTIATDACGCYLMGHDPASDWPRPPFKRDRNHLLLAAQSGFGTVNLDEIDFESEVDPPVADFDSADCDIELMGSHMKTASRQGLFYRENEGNLLDKYGGEFIFIQDGEVIWNGEDPMQPGPVHEVASKKPEQGVWLKKVEPEQDEGEHYSIYEDSLTALPA
jgi:uncharacterized protein (DUF362 family)